MDYTTDTVMDYETSNPLEGLCSEELEEASRLAEPTGAVPAYRDSTGVWRYVPPSEVENFKRNLNKEVVTVFVE